MQAQAELNGDHDQRLAHAVLAGDEEAIEDLTEALRPGVTRLVRNRNPRLPAHECEDKVEQVIIYVMMGVRQNRHGFTQSGFSPIQKWLANPQGGLRFYCLTSARNYLVDLHRLGEVSAEQLPQNETAGISSNLNPFLPGPQEEELFDKEKKRAVQDIYEKLPPHDRFIIMLKYHFDMTDAEVGRKLGISETSARNRRNRAEAKFKRLFVSKYPHLSCE